MESKYFSLFTMIEYIEAKEKNGTLIETHRLMDDSDIKIFEERFSDIFACKEKYGMDNLYSRLKQILKSATVETRAEKLCSVIRNKYEITGITRSLINYEIIVPEMDTHGRRQRVDLFYQLYKRVSVRSGSLHLSGSYIVIKAARPRR